MSNSIQTPPGLGQLVAEGSAPTPPTTAATTSPVPLEPRSVEAVSGQTGEAVTTLSLERKQPAPPIPEAPDMAQVQMLIERVLTDACQHLRNEFDQQAAELSKWRRLAMSLSIEIQRLLVEIPIARLTWEERALLQETITTEVELREAIQASLRDLPQDQARALSLRFGLDGLGPRTFSEVAQALRWRTPIARKAVNDGLLRLRHPSLSWRLRDFLD